MTCTLPQRPQGWAKVHINEMATICCIFFLKYTSQQCINQNEIVRYRTVPARTSGINISFKSKFKWWISLSRQLSVILLFGTRAKITEGQENWRLTGSVGCDVQVFAILIPIQSWRNTVSHMVLLKPPNRSRKLISDSQYDQRWATRCCGSWL